MYTFLRIGYKTVSQNVSYIYFELSDIIHCKLFYNLIWVLVRLPETLHVWHFLEMIIAVVIILNRSIRICVKFYTLRSLPKRPYEFDTIMYILVKKLKLM